MASRDTQGIAAYSAVGIALAGILAYVIGPNIFEAPEGNTKSSSNFAVGLSNRANDCFINSVLQALAGLPRLATALKTVCGDCELASIAKSKEQGCEEKDCICPPDMPTSTVSMSLHHLLEVLTSRPNSKRTISARNFIHTLETVFNARLSRQQQDAHEFLQIVLDRLREECTHRRQSSLARDDGRPAGIEMGGQASARSRFDAGDECPAAQVLSFPFEGQIESIIQCQTCQYKPKPQSNPFVVLTLNVLQDGVTTLDACLDGLLKDETIECYKCAMCCLRFALRRKLEEKSLSEDPETQSKLARIIDRLHEAIKHDSADIEGIDMPHDELLPRTRISKHSVISTYPAILAFHLSRSIFETGSASRKNTAIIQFPETLRMGGFKRRNYKLSCLITHKGDHHSGHYETFRRQDCGESPNDVRNTEAGSINNQRNEPSNLVSNNHDSVQSRPLRDPDQKTKSKWWRISDDRIAEATTRQVLGLNKEAYLLFYELQEDQALG